MLFLVCENSGQPLVSFHQRFYEGRFAVAMQVEEAFEPHLTIARTMESDRFVTAQTAAIGLKLPIYGSINGFDVLEVVDSRITRSTHVPL